MRGVNQLEHRWAFHRARSRSHLDLCMDFCTDLRVLRIRDVRSTLQGYRPGRSPWAVPCESNSQLPEPGLHPVCRLPGRPHSNQPISGFKSGHYGLCPAPGSVAAPAGPLGPAEGTGTWCLPAPRCPVYPWAPQGQPTAGGQPLRGLRGLGWGEAPPKTRSGHIKLPRGFAIPSSTPPTGSRNLNRGRLYLWPSEQ